MSKRSEDKEGSKEQRRKGRPTIMEQLGIQRPRTGNLGSLFGASDAFKRKREEEAEQEKVKAEKELLESFRKNRKVGRSPPVEKEGKAEESGRDMEDQDKLDKI